MAREPRPSHAFKILLFIVLPFVAAVLIAFFLIYVPDRKTSIIERNYRVLETAKRQFQGLFRGRMIAFKRFRREECQPKNAIPLKQVRAVIEQGKEMLSLALKGERELYLQDKDNCAMAIPEIWAPLQKLRVFDNVVLVDSKEEHRILYQWESPHTIPVVDFKSLLASAQHTSQPQQSGSAESTQSEARKPLDMQQLTQTAARKPLDVQQFGITYHLFLIPVSLHQTLPQDFILAGLVRQQHFTNEAYKLSPTLLAVIGFILLMVVLVWPFLTLWYIDPSERLRGLDVRVLIVSSMFAVSLLTFFLLYCFTDLVYQKVFDNDMKTLGKQLKENFEKELEDMFRPLTVLKNSIQRVCDTNLCTKITLQDTAKIKEWDKTLRDKWDKILRDELEQKLWKSSDLLRISSLLWISGEGKSVNRWEPKPLEDSQPPTWKLEPNPQVQKRRTQSGWPTSQDRRYFTDAQAGLLWKLKFKSPSDKTQDIRITLEVVQSQFSGDITVVMAAPVDRVST